MSTTKYLADCQLVNYMGDKYIILTKTEGQDYKLSAQDLVNHINQTAVRALLKTQLGELILNVNPIHSGALFYETNYLKYLQCNGQVVNKADYEDLFNILGIKEDTYKLPDFTQGGGATVRHVPNGSGRALGSYQEAALQSHAHNMEHNHDQDAHSHSVPDVELGHMTDAVELNTWLVDSGAGIKKDWNHDGPGLSRGGSFWTNYCQLYFHVPPHNTNANTINIHPFTGSTANTGVEETRMANIGVQVYIKAKVLI